MTGGGTGAGSGFLCCGRGAGAWIEVDFCTPSTRAIELRALSIWRLGFLVPVPKRGVEIEAVFRRGKIRSVLICVTNEDRADPF